MGQQLPLSFKSAHTALAEHDASRAIWRTLSSEDELMMLLAAKLRPRSETLSAAGLGKAAMKQKMVVRANFMFGLAFRLLSLEICEKN